MLQNQRMLVCEVNSPLPCSATNIKYAVKSGGQRCSAEFATVNEEVDMVLHVHTLLFGFIVSPAADLAVALCVIRFWSIGPLGVVGKAALGLVGLTIRSVIFYGRSVDSAGIGNISHVGLYGIGRRF